MFHKSRCLLTLPSLPVLKQPTGSMRSSTTEVVEAVAVRGNIVGVAEGIVGSGETVGRVEVVAVEVTVEIGVEGTVSVVDGVVVDSVAIVAVVMPNKVGKLRLTPPSLVNHHHHLRDRTDCICQNYLKDGTCVKRYISLILATCTGKKTVLLSEHSEGCIAFK